MKLAYNASSRWRYRADAIAPVPDYPQQLIDATARQLIKRGFSPSTARHFARLIVVYEGQRATLDFTLCLNEAYSEARDELQRKSVMDDVWDNLAASPLPSKAVRDEPQPLPPPVHP
jgi:hypothetical protein